MSWRRNKRRIDKDFVREGAREVSAEELSNTLEKRRKIEDKILSSGMFKKYWEIIKLMFRMLNDYRRGAYPNLPWLTVSTIIFILLYILNPLDIIPDFIPLVGYLDDLTVLTLGLNLVETDLKKYMDWREEKEVDLM